MVMGGGYYPTNAVEGLAASAASSPSLTSSVVSSSPEGCWTCSRGPPILQNTTTSMVSQLPLSCHHTAGLYLKAIPKYIKWLIWPLLFAVSEPWLVCLPNPLLVWVMLWV